MAVHHKNSPIIISRIRIIFLHSLVYLTIDFFPVHPIAQTENSIIMSLRPPCSTPLYNHLRHKWELQNQNDRPYFPEYPDKTPRTVSSCCLSKDNFCPTGPVHQRHHETKVSETNMLPALCNSSGFPFNTLMPKVRK